MVYSSIARLFDPLGLLGPTSMKAKLIMQKLWQMELEWDQELPALEHSEWFTHCEHMAAVANIRIPRLIRPLQDIVTMQLHGFADASELGFGAAIYLRCQTTDGAVSSMLICSKSRVAPLRTQTIPRLELCAALLCARLVTTTKAALGLKIDEVHLWSDSSITLYWLKSPSRKFKTFVANRVAEVQELTHYMTWHHIKSGDNPADVLSRGMMPDDLTECAIWWHGPNFLMRPQEDWPESMLVFSTTASEDCLLALINVNSGESGYSLQGDDLERKSAQTVSVVATKAEKSDLWVRCSDFDTLVRRVAIWIRFWRNRIRTKKKEERVIGPITALELYETTLKLVRWLQKEEFPEDLRQLERHGSVDPRSKLLPLAPFLQDGLIRVGGRLGKSTLADDAKHPMLLPAKHHFTRILLESIHKRNLHCGQQALLAAVRQRFWPMNGRELTRQTTRKCVVCVRAKPIAAQHLMGELPDGRTKAVRPFFVCGVDFAWPFYAKRPGRSPAKDKVWIAVFICFATRAIHLELVGGLSTKDFQSTLDRFVSRRGKPQTIWSDHGTNFMGARKELAELYHALKQSEQDLVRSCAESHIDWRLIPVNAPHFGGLWEAAVKSTKFHLKRIVADTPLLPLEWMTLLAQIEACLNSRPLVPLSADANDLEGLTAGHFLIGAALNAIPQPDLTAVKMGRLDRFQMIPQMVQHFWRRWSCEVLAEMQTRTKWTREHDNMKIGALVVVKDDNAPPQKWRLGRVIRLISGSDDVARVAELQTQGGIITRAVRKLCLLPVDQEVHGGEDIGE